MSSLLMPFLWWITYLPNISTDLWGGSSKTGKYIGNCKALYALEECSFHSHFQKFAFWRQNRPPDLRPWEGGSWSLPLSPCPHLIKGQCFPLPSSVSSGKVTSPNPVPDFLSSLNTFSRFLRHPPWEWVHFTVSPVTWVCVSSPFISGFACWTAIYLPCLFLVNGNNAGALWNLVPARTPGHLRGPLSDSWSFL